MMINTSYDEEGDIKQQKSSNSISRQYSGFKNPRIVKVSPAFGGKDRHSKVLTVRGLRDRRIRLSVPTALQLYYLQDQLGLSQPSKVIDWLLDATKDDIDKLPPLQMPQEDRSQFHLPPAFVPQDFTSTQLPFSPFFNSINQTTKGKEPIVENKWNHHGLHPSSSLSLSQPADTCSFANQYFSGATPPSYFPPCLMPNHFQFLSSSSPHVASNSLDLVGSRERIPFGLNMNSHGNDNG